MTLKTRSCLGLAFGCLALLMGCSDAASEGGTTPDVLSSEPDVAVPEEPSTDDALNPQQDCLEDSDCEESDACQNNGRCEEGSCVFEQLPAGTDCGSFCNPGVCSEKGNCELQSPYDCPDLDGNLCTLPKCDLESDQCVEDTLPNGAPPYASNDCYVDPICIDGIADTSQAGPPGRYPRFHQCRWGLRSNHWKRREVHRWGAYPPHIDRTPGHTWEAYTDFHRDRGNHRGIEVRSSPSRNRLRGCRKSRNRFPPAAVRKHSFPLHNARCSDRHHSLHNRYLQGNPAED